MRLFGNTTTPLINVFHFKSACQKHSSNNLICRSTPGFPMYHKRFGHSNVKKKKKNPITCLVSMKSHSQSCAVLCRDTCLIQSLPSLIFSCNLCCHHFDRIGDFHDIQQLLANYLRLFLENAVQLL